MGKIIRLNTRTKEIKLEEISKEYELLSGRALTSRVIFDEVNAVTEPLGRHNKLVFASGMLAGTNVSSSSRLSIGAKSPLTGGIKESNAGGNAAYYMGRLDIRAIILEDTPESNDWGLLYINKDGVELKKADDLVGLGTHRKSELIRQKFGNNIGLILIGPAGEKRLLSAGITNTDPSGNPGRYAGRGGLGAVMGSKKILAIVIDGKKSTPTFVDQDSYKKLTAIYNKHILDTPQTSEVFPKYGTPLTVKATNTIGALPTRNFHTGSFEDVDKIDGEAVYNTIIARGGKGTPTHSCMTGCIIRCSNVFPDEKGEVLVSPIEYETIGLMGSNLCIHDLDIIARMNYLCNDYGVDTLEIGGAIGVAMEAGVIRFGDKEAALRLMEEIVNDTFLGKILASGVVVTGKVFGQTKIPAVKGQGLPAYEPRSAKGLGVTFITSPMGADHTAGNTIRAAIKHHLKDGQIDLSLSTQVNVLVMDYLGICIMTMSAIKDKNLLSNLINAKIGTELTEGKLVEIAEETLKIERDFNRKAGFTKAHDRLPEFFYDEINPASGCVFDIFESDLDSSKYNID